MTKRKSHGHVGSNRPNGTGALHVVCACGRPGAVYGEGWLKGLCGLCADARKALPDSSLNRCRACLQPAVVHGPQTGHLFVP